MESKSQLFFPFEWRVYLHPSFDGFFLRTASYDVPAEDKSAFALEMDDVRVMLRDSSRRSLALVDELGKGTSARCVSRKLSPKGGRERDQNEYE